MVQKSRERETHQTCTRREGDREWGRDGRERYIGRERSSQSINKLVPNTTSHISIQKVGKQRRLDMVT